MSKELLWLLVVIFVGIGVAGAWQRHWGLCLYGLGAAILNVGVLMMK